MVMKPGDTFGQPAQSAESAKVVPSAPVESPELSREERLGTLGITISAFSAFNAVSAALLANFYTQGEICTNGTRVFVEKPLAGAFLDRLVERTRRLRIGDPI